MRILQTGFADLESVIESINKGQIYRYVTKPWEPKEFATTVKQALDVYEMRETIRQQNIDLTKANQELKSLDKLKTDFMLLVNHELRTPLTAITSYVQLLNEENLAEDHKLYLKNIDKNCDRLQNLIQDTLLITKLKSQDKKIELQSTDLKKLLDDLWNEFKGYYPQQNLKLKYTGEKIFTRDVAPDLIKIIMQKVVRNCYQHAKNDSTVELSLYAQSDSWSLESKNQLNKKIEKTPDQLLNAFSRDEKILNHTGGSGLGLAVIHSIVQLFSGQLDLKFDDKEFHLKLTF